MLHCKLKLSAINGCITVCYTRIFCCVYRFNITTGKYPFEGDNIFKLFEKIGEGVFEVPEEVDELLGSLLKGMLQKDPYTRFSLRDVQNHGYIIR